MERCQDVEIIRHRGRRYKRSSGHSNGFSSRDSSSASSATSDSNCETSLPPIMPKCRDSYTVESFQHQKHKPLPSIGATTRNLDSTETSKDEYSQSLPHSPHQIVSYHNWKDFLLPEPDPSQPYTVLLKVKLSNNSTLQRRFNYKRDRLCHVCVFAHFSSQTEPLNFDFVTLSDNNVPKHNYSDFSLRLDQIGLIHNTLLHYSYES